MIETSFKSKGFVLVGSWCLEEDRNHDNCYSPKWEVDLKSLELANVECACWKRMLYTIYCTYIKAPPPADLIREGSSHKRPSHGGNTVHSPNHASVSGPLSQRHRVSYDDQGAREKTRAAKAGNCSAHNEGVAVGRSPADEGTNFENGDGSKIYALDPNDRVELAE